MGAREEPVDSFVSDLLSWAAAGRVGEAVAARSQARSLLDQAAADSTWSGLMVDLAEAATAVVVATAASRWRGRLVGAGRDFAVVERTGAGPVLVAFRAITSVVASGAVTRPGGDRPPALDLGLAGAVEALAADRAPVAVWSGTHSSHGVLAALGRDFLTLLPDAGRHDPTFIPLAALDALEIR